MGFGPETCMFRGPRGHARPNFFSFMKGKYEVVPDPRRRLQVNLNRPPMMFLRKSGSDPPVGVVRLTKSNTLPSFMP